MGKDINLAKLNVTISAKTASLKKDMEKTKQITRSAVSSINKEIDKVKSPIKSFKVENGALASVKKFQQKLKQSVASLAPKNLYGGCKDRIKQYQLDSGIKVYTDDFLDIEKNIENTEKMLNRYYEKRDKLEALGTNKESAAWKSNAYDIKIAEESLDRYIKKKESLEKYGEDVTKPVSFKRQAFNFGTSLLSKGWGGMTKIMGGMQRTFSRVMPVIKRTSGAFGALIHKYQSVIPWIGKFNSGIRQSNSSLGGGLTKVLKYTIGIRSLFVLMNKLRSAAVEGFQNLAQYSDKTNSSISMLMSSLTQLKNSVAAAFAPVLNVAAPILDALIQKIISVFNVIGQLTSALTGNGTYIRATRLNQDYAASLNQNADNARDANEANRELQKTLLGFDQINKLDDNSNLNSLAGSGNNLGGISPGGMFQTVQIENRYKDLAERIRNLVKKQDWEGLGKEIASEINKGLEHIYNSISWKNVGPKVTAFTDAFTRTMNSLVDNIDWDLMGRDAGAGVNTLTNTLNQVIGDRGIDFRNIGVKFSVGLRGAVDEIEWTNLGNLLGNKFMISWKLLNGFISDMSRENDAGLTGWQELGISLGNSANGLFEKIDFSMLSETLTGGINGAFSSLSEFTETFKWDEFSKNVKGGIETAVKEIHWKENGEAFGSFLSHLCEAIRGSITKDTFYEVGAGIGEFLGELPWTDILGTAAELLIEGFGGALEGLWESGLEGKIVAGLSAAFIAVKIADITGIGTLVGNIVSHIGTSFHEEKNIDKLAGALKETLSSGASEAAGALEVVEEAAGSASSGGISKLIASILGEAGAYVAVVMLTSKLAELVEGFMGGNGILSEMGGALNDLSGKLQNTSQITGTQADEIRNLINECEDAGMSSKDMANTIMEKFSEMGLSTDTLTAILQSNEYQIGKTRESVDILAESAKSLGEGFSVTKQQMDLSGIDTETAFGGIRDSLLELRNTNSEVNDYFMVLDNILSDQLASASPNAQAALDAIKTAMEGAGIPTEELMEMLGTKFPEAAKAVKETVDTNIVGAQEVISSSTGKAEKDATGALENIGKTAEETAATVSRTVSDNFGDVSSTSDRDWSDSEKAVTDSLNAMKGASSEKMRQIFANMKSYTNSIWNITANNWAAIGKKVSDVLGNMNDDISSELNSVVQKFSNFGSRISGSIGDLYSVGRNAMLSFKNGFESVHIRSPRITMDYSSWQNSSGSYSWRWNSNVNWYANGGFPNAGELFMARENGPELVGRMENKNAVANNSQIVDGIKAGVFEAVMDAFEASDIFNQGNSEKDVYIEFSVIADSETIYKFVKKGKKKHDGRYFVTETV